MFQDTTRVHLIRSLGIRTRFKKPFPEFWNPPWRADRAFRRQSPSRRRCASSQSSEREVRHFSDHPRCGQERLRTSGDKRSFISPSGRIFPCTPEISARALPALIHEDMTRSVPQRAAHFRKRRVFAWSSRTGNSRSPSFACFSALAVQDSPFEHVTPDNSSPEILAIDFLKHGIQIGAILANVVRS